MRKGLIAAVGTALLPALALAAPAVGAKPVGHAKPEKHAKVSYVVRGTLTRDATSTSALLSVTSENKHASSALGKLTSLTATVGPKTHITKRGLGKGTFADLKTGDRVTVQWKVPLLTTLSGLSAANRVIDRGPATASHTTKTTKTASH